MRRLLCIETAATQVTQRLKDAASDWDICQVATLVDAENALRGKDVLVGLVVFDRASHVPAKVDSFLRRHGHIQWVGVFSPRDLDNAGRCGLIDHFSDYHTMPVNPVLLAYTLGHIQGWARLLRRPAFGADTIGSDPLIGAGDAIVRLRAHIKRVAQVSAPVLIWGESGSGKELTARAIHMQSGRARGPFVTVNCGAIAPNLIHSEMFGYERGAFTGAVGGKLGLIEAAHGGTLFLDEIGDLPKDLQANFLRFLQEKTIRRLGSTRAIEIDVRVVAASHVQLQEAVAHGTFREDLYYRLAVLPVTVPPLRERRGDLVILADYFFRLYANEKSPRLKGFSERAITAILEHDWPGNVRELINRVRRALVMSEGRLIGADDLGLGGPAFAPAPPMLKEIRARTQYSALRECLDRNGQNISRAARDLGISRTTLYRLLKAHQFDVTPK